MYKRQNSTTPTTFAAPAGAKYFRFSVASLAPGQNFEIYVQATVPASTSLDASLTNCATYTATGATTAGPTCAVTTVDPPAATITPVKAPVSYTHLRAHETVLDLVCRLLLEKKTNHQHLTIDPD